MFKVNYKIFSVLLIGLAMLGAVGCGQQSAALVAEAKPRVSTTAAAPAAAKPIWFCRANWRKLKGVARIRLASGRIRVVAELHWYEAHGIGKKEMNKDGNWSM